MEWEVQPEEKNGERLDRYIAERISDLSRGRIQALLKSGNILLNGKSAKPKTPISVGDCISVELPEPEPTEVVGQEMALEIVHEDEDVIVLIKPAELVVHPAPGNPDGTLVNGLVHHCASRLSSIGGAMRPGIVHRLDKATSGLMVVAKNDAAHEALASQFAARQVSKKYLALVKGVPKVASGVIENHLARNPHNRMQYKEISRPGGKFAKTEYEVVGDFGSHALILCTLHTGRTHQIRVHMKGLGHTILGDLFYGKASMKPHYDRLMLHAWKLGFEHPRSKERMAFTSAIPSEYPYVDGLESD